MSIETLERAIAKLELMSQDAAPRPWVVEPDHHVHDLTVILTEHEYESHQDRILVADYMHKGTAPLVLALSRCVDPLLSLLKGHLEWVKQDRYCNKPGVRVLALARAILGEQS